MVRRNHYSITRWLTISGVPGTNTAFGIPVAVPEHGPLIWSAVRLEWGRGWWPWANVSHCVVVAPSRCLPLNIEEPQARTQNPKLPTLPLTVGGKPGWMQGFSRDLYQERRFNGDTRLVDSRSKPKIG